MRALVTWLALGCVPAPAGWAQTPPAPAQGDVLAQARRAYDAQNFEAALPLLTRAIDTLQVEAERQPSALALLVEAYEMRARARLAPPRLDWDGARADFEALLARAPRHALPATTSPRILKLFEDARRATIGEIRLAMVPDDAQVDLDGQPFVLSDTPTALVAGKHVVHAWRIGYRSIAETIEVRPGAPAQTITLTLERVSSTLTVLTAPSGVEVLIDGAAAGTTPAGPPVGADAEWALENGQAPGTLSGPLVVVNVSPGSHTIELRKDCHVSVRKRIETPNLADYRLPPQRLEPAVASVNVTSAQARGATLFVDGEPRGAVPATVEGLCEGTHAFEVRTPWGRARRQLDLVAGRQLDLPMVVRPTFAVVAATGPPGGIPAVPDLRTTVARALGDDGTIALEAPAAEEVARVLGAQKVLPDFLAFDGLRRPVSEATAKVAPYRATVSAELARALDVAGIATVTVPPRARPGQVCLTLLAAGSSEPDVLELDLGDEAARAAALARLAERPEFFRPAVGVLAIDVADVTGAVIASVDSPAPGDPVALAPGDVITAAGGQPVADAGAFGAALQRVSPGDDLPVTLLRQDGTVAETSLRVTRSPHLVMASDRSLLFNKLVLDVRVSLAQCSDPAEEPVIRLNLGVALMALGNWKEARSELEQVKLPDRPGVSLGTVRYLLGLCAEKLGEMDKAREFWRLAAAAQGALLSDDGPPVKPLAERKLAPARQPRGSDPRR